MKKFIFREAKLLALRKQQVRLAELFVASASAKKVAAQQAVDSEMRAIRELSDRLLNCGRNNVTHISQTAMGLRHRLEEARERLACETEKLSTAMSGLVRAKMAVESIAELEVSRRRAYEDDCQKREQAEHDFLFSRERLIGERSPND